MHSPPPGFFRLPSKASLAPCQKYLYCTNCRKRSHSTSKCNMPICSFGVVAVRYNPELDRPECLMVRPKFSIEYLALLRGHYNPGSVQYITRLCTYITMEERAKLIRGPFSVIYEEAHGTRKDTGYYRAQKLYLQMSSPSPLNHMHTWETHIRAAAFETAWRETEWGFPKGRRNKYETDMECALREFHEETGICHQDVHILKNISQFREVFTGTDNHTYTHIYYMAFVPWDVSNRRNASLIDDKEIQETQWVSFPDSIRRIRAYHDKRRELVRSIYNLVNVHHMGFIHEL